MKKIAILGCENSHADQFLNFIRSDEKYTDIEVVGIFSEEKEAEIKLSEKHNVPILPSVDAAVGKIDGLIVTARDGKNHFPYAKSYISENFPMFIDKPITSSEKDQSKQKTNFVLLRYMIRILLMIKILSMHLKK